MKKINRDELIGKIKERESKLENASIELKKHFVGLNPTIDEIIDSIRVWYIMPEIITHPVIVNLWGMTGVGKTDLIRRLVQLLDLSDRFLEMPMDIEDTSNFHWHSSIQGVLGCSSLEPETPGVVLFDEFQRYRTIDEHGHERTDLKRFQDIWTLLSDGKFSNSGKGKNEILEMLMDTLYYEERSGDDDADVEPPIEHGNLTTKSKNKKNKEVSTKKRFSFSFYSAKSLKKTLRIPDTIETIMKWTAETKKKKIMEAMERDDILHGESYSQLLIFICGNLDSAFWMASRAEDADTDADILHKRSLDINTIDIRTSLKTRFRYEQIARLGNTHIIYPCLSSKSYRELISRKIIDATNSFKASTDIDIKVDRSVNNVLYRNGVFPAQGVRPVFSTINSLFTTSMPPFIMAALLEDCNQIDVSFKDNKMVCKIRDQNLSKKVTCSIDNIKGKTSEEQKHLVALHEASHAVVYMLKFGVAPCQIKSNISMFSGGFVMPHSMLESKNILISLIQVYLAGRLGGLAFFGDGMTSSGCASDLMEATKLASKMLRRYGMGDSLSVVVTSNFEDASLLNLDVDGTNKDIDLILDNRAKETSIIINENLSFIGAIADELMRKNGEMTDKEVAKIAEEFCENKIECLPADHKITESYVDKYNERRTDEN